MLLKMKNMAAIFLILLLCSSSDLLTTSFAGRGSKFGHKVVDDGNTSEEVHEEAVMAGDEAATIHERLLRVNTKDYGRYDPAPALVRPPFKLIPN